MAIIIRIVLLGLILSSCSPWRNDASRLPLTCGPDVDPEHFHYIQVNEAPASFDAVLISDGQWTPLSRTAYGCLAVPRTVKRPAEIAIRDQHSLQGRLLRLETEDGAALVKTELIAEPSLRAEQVKVLCPSDSFVSSQRIPLNRVKQPSRLLSRAFIHAEIFDSKGERLQKFRLAEEASSLDLNPDWAEGRYQLKLISQDIFERNAPAFESSCEILLDRTPPQVSSSLAAEPFYDESQQTRRLAPGAQITFQVQDASGALPHVCLKPTEQVCVETDFISVQAIAAPSEGLWQVQAFATDKAGLRSPLLQERFAVYHQAEVDQLRAQLAKVQLNLLLGLQPAALNAMHDAQAVRKTLKLDGEHKAIQWSYVENFWQLDQELNYLGSLAFSQPVRSVSLNSSRDQILAQGAEGPATLFEDGKDVLTLERTLRSEFSANGSLWTFGNGGILNLYKDRSLVRSFKTGLPSLTLLAAGQTGDKVVLWVDQGQETLVRVYDRRTETDAPAFKVNLPKTPFMKGKYSFFAADRYLIGRNNEKLMIWDSQENQTLRTWSAPAGCVLLDYTVRSDQKIYMVSQRQSTPGSTGVSPEESFCDLQLIDPGNDALNGTLASRFTNVTYPTALALSAEPGQNYLALSRSVGALHFLKLNTNDGDTPIRLNEGEILSRVAAQSTKLPQFLVSSAQRLRLLQFSFSELPVEYFTVMQPGNCLPQHQLDRFLCYQGENNLLNIYTSQHERTLQPSLFRSNTNYLAEQEGAESQYRLDSLLKKSLQAVFDRESRRVQLLDEEKNVRASAQLTAEVTAFTLHESGRLLLGLQDGGVGVLEEGQPLSLWQPSTSAGVMDLHMTGDGEILVLEQKSEGVHVLNRLRYENGSLRWISTLPLPEGTAYSAILYNEKSAHGVIYQKNSEPQEQEALLFNSGTEVKRLAMTMCSLRSSGEGFYFVREGSIYFHDFSRGSEQLVAADIGYEPCEFIEGSQLYAVTSAPANLHEVSSGRRLATGQQYGVGPQGTLLVADNRSLRILSADGQTTLATMKFRIATQVERILSSPDEPDIVLIYSQYPLGQGLRRLTTDLDSIDQRLHRWGLQAP